MEEQLFTKIMVEVNGKVVNLADLPKEQYEEFLELMQSLILAYKVISENRGKS